MSERRVKISHPDGKKLFDLANLISIATNPQRWFNGNQWVEGDSDDDLTELGKVEEEYRRGDRRKELRRASKAVKKAMKKELEGGAFRDYLNE